ncbi:hypothetical protein UZ36_07720 [Candidatus Nitromaritima sp. SCGC AAA799-C22]|nr:hypothetical protein UZ36_07720 [Candidatus Nitromaritima sp. SCGC AAA799-C22]
MIKQKLSETPGFSTDLSLENEELVRLRHLIRDQWLGHIKTIVPEHVNRFEELGMERYHEASHLLDHGSVWPKKVRILPQDAVLEIRKMNFISQLENYFGPFEISDEENVGREEIYWRLVRPNEKNDIGPLHADGWFWELGHGTTPDDVVRVKVWIGIYVETGLNGFVYVPDSHLKDWPYHAVLKDGFNKPMIDVSEDSLNPLLFESKPGDAIIFHDKLLHGGAPSRGDRTRVSLEFTMFVKPW